MVTFWYVLISPCYFSLGTSAPAVSSNPATEGLGGLRAQCAAGRSILVIVWHLLASPEARFTDPGPGWHELKAGRDRKIRAHLRGLQALGLDVTLTPAAA